MNLQNSNLISKARRHPTLAVVLGLTVVAAIVWRAVCPAYKDDWIYMHAVAPGDDFWLATGDRLQSWSQVWPTIVDHWNISNGRLANYLMILSNLVPHWLVVVMCGLAVASTPWLALAVGAFTGSRRASLSQGVWLLIAVVAVWLSWVAFPWRDCMQSTDFLLNYCVAGAMMLAAFLLFFRVSCMGRLAFAATLIYTFLTAWMHESVSAVMIAVMAVGALLDRRARRRMWLLCGTAVVGFAAVMSAPPTLKHVMGGGWYAFSTRGYLADYFSIGWLAGIFLVSMAVIVAMPGWRRRLVDSRSPLIALTAGVIASLVIGYRAHMVYRVEWSGLACALAGLTYIALRVRWPRWRWYSTVASGLLAVLALFMGQLIGWQYRAKVQTERIEAALDATPGDIVYLDGIVTQREVPWYMLDIPRFDAHTEYWTNLFMAAHHGRPGRLVAVMPTKYYGQPFDLLPKIPGYNPFHGIADQPLADENLGDLTVTTVHSDEHTYATHPWEGSPGGEWPLPLTPSPVITMTGDTLWMYLDQRGPYQFSAPRHIRNHPIIEIR